MTIFRFSYEQVFDANGDPLPGAKLYFYESGTSTPKNTYSDAGLTVPNSNPVIADSAGRFASIFLDPENYKVALHTAQDTLVWTSDPEQGASEAYAGSFSWGGTAALVGNAYSISLTPKMQAYDAGSSVRFIVGSANPAAGPTLNIDGIGAKPLVNVHGIAMQTGWMQPGVHTVVYDGANFVVSGAAADVIGHTIVGTPVAIVDFTLPPTISAFALDMQCTGSVSGANVLARVGHSAGASIITTGYQDSRVALSAASTVSGTSGLASNSGTLAVNIDSTGVVAVRAGLIRIGNALVCNYQSSYLNSTGPFYATIAGGWRGSTSPNALDTLRLFLTSGNFAAGSTAILRQSA